MNLPTGEIIYRALYVEGSIAAQLPSTMRGKSRGASESSVLDHLDGDGFSLRSVLLPLQRQ